MGELRQKVLEKGKDIENVERNNLSNVQLRHLNGKLKFKNISREFHLQCMRDLDDAEMPIYDFLATMLDGKWEDYGETEEEVETARELIKNWSQHYLKARDIDDFMQKLGFQP